MELFEDWEIEECRTKFESEEHWTLRKDFITTHKNSFSKQRLLCLAQVFANIQLFRCKYPDPVMKQVAELSEGIGKDYQTKQKERLQRTFVKASEAAKAKVLGLKQQTHPPNSLDGSPKAISFVKEASTEPCKNPEAQRINPQTVSEDSLYLRFLKEKSNADCPNLNTETLSVLPINSPKLNTETLSVAPINSVQAFKRKTKKNKFPIRLPKIAAIVDTGATSELSERLSSSLNLNSEDLNMSNLFFMYRSYINFSTFYTLLKNSTSFCHYELINNFHVDKTSGESICTLSVNVRGRTLTLGSGKNIIQKMSQENASKDAFTNILKWCHMIEIKTLVSGTEEVALEKLLRPSEEKKISSDSIGAKMMMSMGWSGGALGKTGQGIVEPLKTQKIVGRQGLGINKELQPTPLFLQKVKSLLDEMVEALRTQPEAMVPDLIFSSELSNEQRKSIHAVVRKKYQQLKSLSYGKDEDRFLSVKPKVDIQSLFHKILSQGGVTDQYTIHKPGTLSLDDISKIKSALKRTTVEKSLKSQTPNYVLTPSDCYSTLANTLKSINLVLAPKYKKNKDGYLNCKLTVSVKENDYFLGSHRGASKFLAKDTASVRAVLMFILRNNIVVQEIEKWIEDKKINLELCGEQIESQSMNHKKEESGAQQTLRKDEFHVSYKQTFRDYLFENFRKCIHEKRSNKGESTSVEEVNRYPYDSYVVDALKRIENHALSTRRRTKGRSIETQQESNEELETDHDLLDSFDLSSSDGLNGLRSVLTKKVKSIDGLGQKPFYLQFIQDLCLSLCDEMKAEDVLKVRHRISVIQKQRLNRCKSKATAVRKINSGLQRVKDESHGRKNLNSDNRK